MVENICPNCGLPKELCVCKIIEREARKIKIYVTTRKYRKPVTIVEGIDKGSGKSISKQLKRKLACGGSFKDGNIELQGNHLKKVNQLLIEMGFDKDQIEIS